MPSRHSTSPLRPEVRVVGVLVPQALNKPYDYAVPPGMPVVPGAFVRVPLRNTLRTGVVWDDGQGCVDVRKLKKISELLDLPPMPDASRAFVDWIANYTLAVPGNVLRMAMSVREALLPRKAIVTYSLASGIGDGSESLPDGLRLTASRKKVITVLSETAAMSLGDLTRRAGVTPPVVRKLAEAGVLKTGSEQLEDRVPQPDPHWQRPALSPAQKKAADHLKGKVRSGSKGFSVTLLDGVTGSGKTAVYFEAIAAAIDAGRQVAVLLPEIALTGDWLARFTERFGVPPIVWHSNLSASERRRNWRAVLGGTARLVVGARSALLLPFRDLGLIIVDEEHDTSFKQEDGVIYNARDMAVVRGRIGDFPVILSSATPSLETVDNVWRGRYGRVSLTERFAGARLPKIAVADLRQDAPDSGSWISKTLGDEIARTLDAGEQVMLFLNRRGYAPLTVCRACGHYVDCPHCTARLVEHRSSGRLHCHHCGYQQSKPTRCPSCDAEGRFAACGPGVERISEEVEACFPAARLAVMSSDTVETPEASQALVDRMQRREIDILIGTQIVAKGFHFPFLTLVGVIDADLGLSGGDLRAAERTFQLLHQVSGRAGRGQRQGRAVLQTYNPDHPVIGALISGDRDKFLEAEAEARRQFGMPPYGRLAAIILSGRHEGEVDATANALGRAAPLQAGVEILGPAPAPIAVIRNRHRRRFLVCARKDVNIQGFLRNWVFAVRPPGDVRVVVDVDPYSFL